MTRAIDAFNFGIDMILKSINKYNEEQVVEHMTLFNNTLNNLIAETMLYFTNRIGQMLGKDIKSIRSIPEGKSMLKKKFIVEIKDFIGSKGYKELKKLDEKRGGRQHKNDRYFIDYKVNKWNLTSSKELKKYTLNIQKIIIELDKKLDNVKRTHEVITKREGNNISIETKTLTHSFDLIKGKMNKKEE